MHIVQEIGKELLPLGTVVYKKTHEIIIEASIIKNDKPFYEVLVMRKDGQTFWSTRSGNDWAGQIEEVESINRKETQVYITRTIPNG